MASLTNVNAVKYRHLGQEGEGIEKPQAETLRDKILKRYLQKQLRTDTSIDEYRQSQREFCQMTVEESITSSTEGLTSYKQFQEIQNSLAVKQVLRSSGLSEEEIKLLLNDSDEKTSLQDPLSRHKWLLSISEKLENRQQQLDILSSQPEQFRGAVPLNRNDFEEEMNSVPCTEKADKLSACLVRLQPQLDESIPADHPINHIKEIAEELFPFEGTENRDQKESRKRNYDCTSCEKSEEVNVLKHVYLSEKPKTFWDMKEIPKIIHSSKSNYLESKEENRSGTSGERKKLYVKKKDKVVKHDPSKPYVLTLNDHELIPLHQIKSQRKTLDELREIEKFKNLKEEGEPSETLYIKNLSHKTSPSDLASLFGHFESKSGTKIQYRILNGRMKGQAFVTFQNKDIAISAFKTCSGYILHEKPIILEYSKR